MKSIWGAGGLSAITAAALLLVGGSTEAWAQQVQAKLPVVQAVLSTPTVNPVEQAVTRPANELEEAAEVATTLALPALVQAHRAGDALDEEGKCLATAVYFESMGEPLEGQLAVANVVINRAKSGRYPSSWCGVVKQKAQFSFVRNGRFPRINYGTDAWAKAEAIARIAAQDLKRALPSDVLWYHADYVAPKWRRNLTKVEKIGAHIFYRS